MVDSREILLKLVRMAMGWETNFSTPEDVGWQEVFTIALEQGVDGIVIDGLEAFILKQPIDSPIRQSDKFKQVLFEAIGGLQMIEINYSNHLEALKELSVILSKKDIPFMIMKGFACGQYYPKPEHRPCGDIDIFPGSKYDDSNEALKEAGISVEPYYYRHSASYIKNVMIENHRVLGDLRGPRMQTRLFEDWLEREANISLKEGKQAKVLDQAIPGAVYPTADFNTLFLPWHVSAHFMVERVTLRQLLDWALFLVHDGKNIDIVKFREAKKQFTFGYKKFADILTNLSLRYLNIPTVAIPDEIVEDAVRFDNTLADKVFDYMFEGQPKERGLRLWKERLNNMKHIWQERWKYKELYGMSVLSFLYYKVKGAVINIED